MAYDGKEFKGPGGVNVAECLYAADLVEKASRFTMGEIYHSCGTPACIFGHIVSAEEFAADKEADGWAADPWRLGAQRLGISSRQAYQLFEPVESCVHWSACRGSPLRITNAHAAACLRKLAATGEVDWLGTKPEGK